MRICGPHPVLAVKISTGQAPGTGTCRFADLMRLDEQHVRLALTVPSRHVRVFRLASGQRLVVAWQPGYNGPPGEPDVRALRRALAAE